jgi:predicted transcriptional regulator
MLKIKQKELQGRLLQNKETYEKNRKKILEIISSEKYYLDEIISKSFIGKKTVLKHLKIMQKENLIDNFHEDGKSYYVLTTKGKEILEDVRKHQEFLGNLKNTGSTYFNIRSELGIALSICSLPWGIVPHMTINEKLEPLKLLKNDDIEEIEKIIFEKISKNIKNIREYNVNFRRDALDLLEQEKFVLSFNVDLTKIHKSIEEKSLETYEDMPEEEIASRFQAELDQEEDIDDSVFD